MPTYTNVPKPTNATYVSVSKPSDPGTTGGPGYAHGTMGMTYWDFFPGTSWSGVTKPSNSTYTNIAKPTT